MNYLYHRVPENMHGDVLYPFSKLEKIYPDIYNEEFKKYSGREWKPEDKIPYIGCKWKDVINLIALNPQIVVNNLKKAGGNPPLSKWYEISTSVLNEDKLVVFLYRQDLNENGHHLDLSNFERFNPKNLKRYSVFPKETLNYFSEEYSKGRRPLAFHLIPHILYNGGINVNGLEVIETK